MGVPAHAVTRTPEAKDGVTRLARAVAAGKSVSVDRLLPWRANMVGFSFDGEADLEVRALDRDGWTPWTHLHADPDESAEGAEAAAADRQLFTAPMWVGSARRIQARATADGEQVRNLRLHYINTSGDAQPVSPLRRAGRALLDVLTAQPASVAEAKAARPSFISRSEWGADESIGDAGPGAVSRIKMAFIHHTANSNSYSKSESDDLVRGIYRYHVLGRGYSDIGYNFIVDRYGQVFEGRKGGVGKAVVGAHTLGFNTYSTGIALLGTFSTATPPSGMLSALKKLIAWKFDVHHIPVIGKTTMTSGGNDKYSAGTSVTFNRLSGHRDGTSTGCPGQETYERLGSIRSGADAIGHPKIYIPNPPGTTIRRDGDGIAESVRFEAAFSRTVSWRLAITDGAGVTRRSWSGSGTSMSILWSGKNEAGVTYPTGRYEWRLTASRSGVQARPAGDAIYVIDDHPHGTLLRDSAGTYMLDSGVARPISTVARHAKFGALPRTWTGPGERARYVDGSENPVPIRNGTLLRDAAGNRYIYSAGMLRRFATEEDGTVDVFAALAYDPVDLLEVGSGTMSKLTPGPAVTDTTLHPDGTVIKNMSTGSKYLVDGGVYRPITTLARVSRYRATEVVPATEAEVALIATNTGLPVDVRSGSLLRDPEGGEPWLVAGAQRRRFVTWNFFDRLGFTTDMLLPVSQADLTTLAEGPVYG